MLVGETACETTSGIAQDVSFHGGLKYEPRQDLWEEAAESGFDASRHRPVPWPTGGRVRGKRKRPVSGRLQLLSFNLPESLLLGALVSFFFGVAVVLACALPLGDDVSSDGCDGVLQRSVALCVLFFPLAHTVHIRKH